MMRETTILRLAEDAVAAHSRDDDTQSLTDTGIPVAINGRKLNGLTDR